MLNGRVRPGDTVVVVGAGPIGLATIATAQLDTPGRIIAVDLAESRLDAARSMGADVVIEAVGAPEAFEQWTRMVRPGGHVANVGVHGKPAALHLEDLWIKDVTITTGPVDTHTTPLLLRMMAAGRLPAASAMVTHRFELEQMEEAYDVFAGASRTGALKVVLGGPKHDEVSVVAWGLLRKWILFVDDHLSWDAVI